MAKRRYKTKWYRYGTIIGVLLVAIGGVIMILLGVTDLLNQSAETPFFFVANFVQIPTELAFLWSVLTIICGVVILVFSAQQKPHEQDTLAWIIVAALLGILGGTLGGLIVFGGALIYFLLYLL
ncbi:MAG: hypothetical protein ACFE95_10640 [Candidatus Hodarchaeota archaeon]